MSAQVGAGGAVWTAPGGRAGRAGRLPPGPGLRAVRGWTPAGLTQAGCAEKSLGILTQAISDLPSNPFHFAHFLARSGVMQELAIFTEPPP